MGQRHARCRRDAESLPHRGDPVRRARAPRVTPRARAVDTLHPVDDGLEDLDVLAHVNGGRVVRTQPARVDRQHALGRRERRGDLANEELGVHELIVRLGRLHVRRAEGSGQQTMGGGEEAVGRRVVRNRLQKRRRIDLQISLILL